MKIKLSDSAKRVFANTFSPRYEEGKPLIPDNIKKDVDILGVIGTYDGGEPVPPTPGLTLFNINQIVEGIVVDPTAMSDSDLSNFLDNATPQSQEGILLNSNGQMNVIIDSENSVKFLIVMADENNIAVFAQAPITLEGFDLSAGWNLLDMSTQQATPLSQVTNLYAESVCKIQYIDDTFATLNGVVLGAIEGQPQPTGTTFKDLVLNKMGLGGDFVYGINAQLPLKDLNGNQITSSTSSRDYSLALEASLDGEQRYFAANWFYDDTEWGISYGLTTFGAIALNKILDEGNLIDREGYCAIFIYDNSYNDVVLSGSIIEETEISTIKNGDYLPGFIVNADAYSEEYLNDFIRNHQNSNLYQAGKTDWGVSAFNMESILGLRIATYRDTIFYFSDDFGNYYSKGWSKYVDGQLVGDHLTGLIEISIPSSQPTSGDIATNVSSDWDPLNGTLIGKTKIFEND